MAQHRFRTLARPSRFEPERIKGSRFIACVAPTATRPEAQEFVDSVRAEFPGAGHHCYGWRLDPEGRETRAFDDGEPNASAGAPILRQIEGHNLSGVTAVVVRWFGGTKLGVGGLLRAYGGAAGAALDRADIVEVRVRVQLTVEYPYVCSGAVDGALAQGEARVLNSDYGATIRATISVPLENLEPLRFELVERTAGRLVIASQESAG